MKPAPTPKCPVCYARPVPSTTGALLLVAYLVWLFWHFGGWHAVGLYLVGATALSWADSKTSQGERWARFVGTLGALRANQKPRRACTKRSPPQSPGVVQPTRVDDKEEQP